MFLIDIAVHSLQTNLFPPQIVPVRRAVSPPAAVVSLSAAPLRRTAADPPGNHHQVGPAGVSEPR